MGGRICFPYWCQVACKPQWYVCSWICWMTSTYPPTQPKPQWFQPSKKQRKKRSNLTKLWKLMLIFWDSSKPVLGWPPSSTPDPSPTWKLCFWDRWWQRRWIHITTLSWSFVCRGMGHGEDVCSNKKAGQFWKKSKEHLAQVFEVCGVLVRF